MTAAPQAEQGSQGAHAPQGPRGNEDVLRRVRSEFMEMPGLRVTVPEARRLWGLDVKVCEALLTDLVDAKFLFQTRDGAFMRVEGRGLGTRG